jgi:tRNA threonylcarbamoyladenosine biosynthesis protein TsaE
MKFLVHSSSELADQVYKLLKGREGDPLVVGLIGELGAGKTTLVQGIAKKLGISQLINSPTFNIAKLYPTKSAVGTQALYHIDLYRLGEPTRADLMEISEQMSVEGTLTFIEWIDNSPELYAMADLLIKIKILSQTVREVETKWK